MTHSLTPTTHMKVLSQKEFEEKIANFRICLEHFPGTSTIRLEPPKQCHLLSIPFGKETPFSLKNLNCASEVFYCVGREQVITLPGDLGAQDANSAECQNVRHPICLTCEELCRVINEARPFRNDVTGDFYAISDMGTFMLYVSHHDEVLLYFGWTLPPRSIL
jgi:hypothetical protein